MPSASSNLSKSKNVSCSSARLDALQRQINPHFLFNPSIHRFARPLPPEQGARS